MTEGKYEITIYTSCCNTAKGIYYYTTYDNHQITAVDMHAENLDSDQLICYPLLSKGEETDGACRRKKFDGFWNGKKQCEDLCAIQ